MCVTREMEWGSSKMCTGVYMGRGVSRLKCMLMMMYGRTPHTSKGQGHTPHHIASCLGPTSLLASYITLSSMVHLLRIQNKAFILFYGLRLALFVMPTGQLFVFVMRFSISDFCFSVSVIHFLSLVSNIWRKQWRRAKIAGFVVGCVSLTFGGVGGPSAHHHLVVQNGIFSVVFVFSVLVLYLVTRLCFAFLGYFHV